MIGELRGEGMRGSNRPAGLPITIDHARAHFAQVRPSSRPPAGGCLTNLRTIRSFVAHPLAARRRNDHRGLASRAGNLTHALTSAGRPRPRAGARGRRRAAGLREDRRRARRTSPGCRRGAFRRGPAAVGGGSARRLRLRSGFASGGTRLRAARTDRVRSRPGRYPSAIDHDGPPRVRDRLARERSPAPRRSRRGGPGRARAPLAGRPRVGRASVARQASNVGRGSEDPVGAQPLHDRCRTRSQRMRRNAGRAEARRRRIARHGRARAMGGVARHERRRRPPIAQSGRCGIAIPGSRCRSTARTMASEP